METIRQILFKKEDSKIFEYRYKGNCDIHTANLFMEVWKQLDKYYLKGRFQIFEYRYKGNCDIHTGNLFMEVWKQLDKYYLKRKIPNI